MSSEQRQIRVGNLTRDPQLRFSAKGGAWTTTGLAVDRWEKGEDGERVQLDPEYFDLVCFGETAENVAESLVKGDRVIVVGRIEDAPWVGRDGHERKGRKIVADEVGPSLRRGPVQVSRITRSVAEIGAEHLAQDLAATSPEELLGPLKAETP